ncbi:probable glycosyl transferase, group 1 [Psychrobacter arcticus 273-4]|uniref:Probable glycosyl transferase, group 1 n=1 Tax=Psychrobacter arcticus (strain DSM 17307 / VKM B-2377 / 273-4) TaxID=259536 RepID=Q4FTX9_PSYA2|nr:glycosyltransferase family 4 protein [Psychrobacter arcticus]AAZ18529.1 probable glycosyl transferase, group 1 [Psychrobacter arcticus 273-4]
MKILYIVNEPWFFLSHRLPIALAAKEQGHTVHVATRDGKAVKEITDMGFIHHDIPLSRSGSSIPNELNSLFAIWKLLTQVKPDVLHLVTIKPVVYGGIAARFTVVPKVVAAVSGLGTLFLATGFKAQLKRKLGTWLYHFALSSNKTTVIFQNPDDKRMFIDLKAVKPEQTVLIRGSGIDLSAFSFFPENLTDKPVVTFAARLLFDKGLTEYIEAIKLLNNKGIAASYQIVGDLDPGNLTSAKNRDIELWKSIPNLSIRGYQKDMAAVFRHSNLVVLPSYREGLPKVLIEAAACGRAVITTDVPGCRDAIEANETGLLVAVKSPNELADAIEKLVTDTILRVRMGTAGRQLAENAFSIEQVVDQHLSIYQQY